MARNRRTLALILLFIPILITVISAFRVRDLPKNFQNSLKTELLKKQKVVQCFDCGSDGVKDGQKHTSNKIESDTRYEELKKAVREKQQQISQKGPNKSSFKFVDNDLNHEAKINHVSSKLEVVKASNGVKTYSKKLSSTSNDVHLIDIENEEDGADAGNISTEDKKKPTHFNKKSSSVIKEVKKESKFAKVSIEDAEDKDEEDLKGSDKRVEKPKVLHDKKSELKYSQTATSTKETSTKPKVVNESNDDDDEDDDDESEIQIIKNTLNSKMTKVSDLNLNTKSIANKGIAKDYYDDDADDDDEEDDDDEDDDTQLLLKNHFAQKKDIKAKPADTNSNDKSSKDIKPKDILKTKVVSKEYQNDEGDDDDDDDADDDDDDDDDDDGNNDDSEKKEEGFFSGFFSTMSKLTAELIEDTSDTDKKLPEEKSENKDTVKKQVTTNHKTPIETKKEQGNKLDIQTVSISEKKKSNEQLDKKETVKRVGEPSKQKPPSNPKANVKSDTNKENKPVVKESKPKVKPQSAEKRPDTKIPIIKSKDEASKEPITKHKESEKVKSKSDVKETKDLHEVSKKSQLKETPPEPSKKQKEPVKLKTEVKETMKSHDESKKSELDKSQTSTKPESKTVTKQKREVSVETFVDTKDKSTKKENPLKDVNEALYRKNLLKSEFEDYYAFFPTFAPNFSRIPNPECRRHGQILLRQLRGSKLWALNMLDATAKIPSGVLQGNGIQLGDFDQCMACRARVQLDTGSVVKIHGKYCLARLDVKAEDPELEGPVHLAQAKNLIRSRVDDPGHFVPRFSTLSWGVCVPSACGPEDVEVVIKDAVKHYQHKSGVVLKVKVEEEDCQTDEGDWFDDWLELPTILTLLFYVIIILLVLVATAKDYLAGRNGEEKDEGNLDETKEVDDKQRNGAKNEVGILGAFSLYHTTKKLLAPGTSEDIPCIHGVRAMATIALLVAHKFLPVASNPYTNRVQIAEVVSSFWWSWARAGWMYTDCFLLLSGTLTAYRISETDSAPRRLLSRYLRLTPALFAVVLFYAYIWDNINSGPMWGSLVTKNAEVCQDGWWWNLFYVQNWFGFEDMCAPQTHQLALDMQLTILGGVMVWLLQLEHWSRWLLMPSLHIFAAYSRYTTVQEHRLTLLAYHGVTVSQLYRTARLSYTSVLHRSTPYLVGISLGMMLRAPAEHGAVVRIIGWVTAGFLWSLVWWAGIDAGSTTYHYSATFAAQYSALAPIASAISVALLIYAVHTAEPGLLTDLFSSWPLVVISRLSYALYLCQFVVFLTNAATVRFSSQFSILALIDIQEVSLILLSSTILTLTFVIPMQTLHKAFTFPSKSEAEEKNEKNDTETDEVSEQNVEQQEIEPLIEEITLSRGRQILVAHREVLEEIPEAELEYEMQREKDFGDGLEEILEEEEDEELGDEEMEDHLEEDDLEVIEEEGGEDEVDFWGDREEYVPIRNLPRAEDRDLDEWEWTNGRNGEQHSRYSR